MARTPTLWLGLGCLGLFLLPGCKNEQATMSGSKSGLKITVTDLTYPPVSTFEESCSRCHGPQGSFFGKDFARVSDPNLTQVV